MHSCRTGTVFEVPLHMTTEERDLGGEKKAAAADVTVIPVIQEQATIHTEIKETAKVKIRTTVAEVEKTVDVPLVQEGYEVKRIPINQLVDAQPPTREEGDVIIIPVVREVLVVEKRLELVEEVHVIKHQTTVNHKETLTLKREDVHIERISSNNK